MKTYSEKLKDPRWQRKRLEVMWAYEELSAKEHMEKTGEENPLR